jgi:hypothetical protein
VSDAKIAARVSLEDRRLMDEVCDARGEDLSSFIRRSIKKELASFGFYSDEVRNALGIQERK